MGSDGGVGAGSICPVELRTFTWGVGDTGGVISGRLLFLGVDIGGACLIKGEVAGEGDAVRAGMFVLTSSIGLRDLTRSKTIKVIRGMIVSSKIKITPSRVKRKNVRLPIVSKKNNSKFLRRFGGRVSSRVSSSSGRIA